MNRMKRAVGYCEDTDCDDYAKGVFLLNPDKFRCPRCRTKGLIVPEKGHFVGNSHIFKEVRVEFNYCAVNHKFQTIAIVRDESLWGSMNVYTLQSPLIKTEKRALKVAEQVLANLNKYGILAQGDIPGTQETLFNMGDPIDVFKSKLEAFAKDLENSGLRGSDG